MMSVLVLNVGSATLKFQVVATDADRMRDDRDVRLIRGQIERIGGESVITLRGADGSARTRTAPLRDLAHGGGVAGGVYHLAGEWNGAHQPQ